MKPGLNAENLAKIRDRAKAAFEILDQRLKLSGNDLNQADAADGFGLHRVRNITKTSLDYRVVTGWKLPVKRDKLGRVYVQATKLVEDPTFVSRQDNRAD